MTTRRRWTNVGRPAYAGLAVLIASLGGAIALSRSGQDAFRGAVVAYASDRSGQRAIWLSDARTSTEVRAEGCGGSGSYSPAWSPNGRQLAFLTVRAAQRAVCIVESAKDVGRIVFETDGKASNIAWHPSGRRLLMTRTADDGTGTVVEVALSGQRDEVVLATGPEGFGRPAWRPDGDGFVVATGRNHLQFYDRKGTLTETWGDTADQSPVWSRDGSRLVFVREQQRGGWALMVLEARTKRSTTVASSENLLFHPDWSRNGRRLAFEAYDTRSGSADIFLIDASGGGATRVLVAGPGDDGSPALRP